MSIIFEEYTIDTIEGLTLEAEMSVLFALCDCYQKQTMILENTACDSLSEFSVFQENFYTESKSPNNNKIVGLLSKAIQFLIKAFKNFCSKIRDSVKNVGLDVKLAKYKKSLKGMEVSDGEGMLRNMRDEYDLRLDLNIKYENNELKILCRSAWDIDMVYEALRNFDLREPGKSVKMVADASKVVESYEVGEFIVKTQMICAVIESRVLKSLEYELKRYNEIIDTGNYSEEDDLDPDPIDGGRLNREILNKKVSLIEKCTKLWSEALKLMYNEFVLCAKLTISVSDYLSKKDTSKKK
ncbi:MAG: hypothetical protein IKA36_02840 [Clostridia bacterium]|nr:hypothetical protein [Clostridia bacterium]